MVSHARFQLLITGKAVVSPLLTRAIQDERRSTRPVILDIAEINIIPEVQLDLSLLLLGRERRAAAPRQWRRSRRGVERANSLGDGELREMPGAVLLRLLFEVVALISGARLPEPGLEQPDVDAHQPEQAHDARGDGVGTPEQPDDGRIADQPEPRLMFIRLPVLGNMIEDVKKNGLHGLGPSLGRGVQQSPCLFRAVPGGYLIQDEGLDRDRRGSRHGGMLPSHLPASITCVIFTKQGYKSRVATQPRPTGFT
jgi:hypothetical protein